MPSVLVDLNRTIIPARHTHIPHGNDVIMRVQITAPENSQQQQPRLPLNIGLVIDRSGSMAGKKLSDAVDACRRIVQRLNEIDFCSIVTFDDSTSTIADAQRVTAARRALMLHGLDAVRSGGSTNLSAGWQSAATHLLSQHTQHPNIISHIMLLTDGMANEGITDIESLESMARDYHNRGISVSTYGLGQGYAERELRRIAEAGLGTHQFIEHSADIERYFSNELSELFTVTYRDVSVRINIPNGFSAEVIGQLPHKQEDGAVEVTIGGMIAREQRTIYVRLTPLNSAESSHITLTATLSGTINNDTTVQTTSSAQLQVATPELAAQAPINGEIEYEAVLVDIAYVRSEAQRLNRERNYAEAHAYVLRMQSRSDVFARYPIYTELANEMRNHIDDWRAKRSESVNSMSRRSSVKDLYYLREQLAELLRRGIDGTEIIMLREKIEMLERKFNRHNDDQQ